MWKSENFPYFAQILPNFLKKGAKIFSQCRYKPSCAFVHGRTESLNDRKEPFYGANLPKLVGPKIDTIIKIIWMLSTNISFFITNNNYQINVSGDRGLS